MKNYIIIHTNFVNQSIYQQFMMTINYTFQELKMPIIQNSKKIT